MMLSTLHSPTLSVTHMLSVCEEGVAHICLFFPLFLDNIVKTCECTASYNGQGGHRTTWPSASELRWEGSLAASSLDFHLLHLLKSHEELQTLDQGRKKRPEEVTQCL